MESFDLAKRYSNYVNSLHHVKPYTISNLRYLKFNVDRQTKSFMLIFYTNWSKLT
jgi:hypothetical protein